MKKGSEKNRRARGDHAKKLEMQKAANNVQKRKNCTQKEG